MKHFIMLLMAAACLSTQATRPMRQVINLKNGKQFVLEKKGCSCNYTARTFTQSKRRSFDTTSPDGLGIYGQSAHGTLPSVGEIEIPIVMAGFADCTFQTATTRKKIERLFNEEGYHDLDCPATELADDIYAAGSVRDYFIYNSGGLFKPHFTVVDSVTVSGNREQYGKNSKTTHDVGKSDFVNEALRLAAQNGADFKPFLSASGSVPLVIVLFAGPGEHASYEEGSENYLWPCYQQGSRSAGGVLFNSYFIGNELMQDYKPADDYATTHKVFIIGQHIAGIGVLIHELGHALGLPDEYDTTSSTPLRPTPDYWSVMDYGQYQENSYRPMQYSAYERSCLGWLDLKPLEANAGSVTVNPGEGYIVRNPETDTQYYILETRSENPWYRSNRFGTGLMVWHIDYVKSLWTGNRPNNDLNRQCIRVVPADSTWQSNSTRNTWSEFRSDLYPGDSNPSTAIYGRPYTKAEFYGLPIFDIADDGEGHVSFNTQTEGIATTPANRINISMGDNSGSTFNLQGRRLSHPKGLFIQNNQKTIIR
ncbi:MAG: M6 family metalloprotease domain-containing protein [Bacteroidales bacterium]|nr:M6 family metalloprotease domain-containing protein [Candidatus Equimonas faecalis]